VIPNTFIEIYDDLLPHNLCDEAIGVVENHIDVGIAHNGRNASKGSRRDFQVYLNTQAPRVAQAIYPYIQTAFDQYASKYPSIDFFSLNAHEIKVQKIEPQGGFYNWHCEQGFPHQQAVRYLTFMAYLNDTEEDDGTTEFIEYGIKVQPKKGRVLLFPAGFTHTHRGNPVYKSSKYIITGWFLIT